ncbi:diguanylate cyclase [Alteromonas sp. C1M14]|uniref:sensor domain-containing diguanylate cyclase n=1 Tax=Alteromonas sp. C1M14 TaxID=2841567 RepID=UPI001C0A1BFE|nr:diguanylate cyclase [Alteromonas sp. C1M14]MBU2978689.1 diguanylate cyclase [Alteromonas sp. C1M14]
MILNADIVRRFDKWLVVICLLMLVFFAYVMHINMATGHSQPYLSEVKYANSQLESFSISRLDDSLDVPWITVANPINLGIQQGQHWIYFHLPEGSDTDDPSLLEVAYPLLDQVTAYFFTDHQALPIHIAVSGDSTVFHNREIQLPSIVFPIPSVQSDIYVILKVVTSGPVKIPLKVWKTSEFVAYSAELNLTIGCFYGFLLAICLSTFFLFLTTRRSVFVFYSAYVFCLLVTLVTLAGLLHAYIGIEKLGFEQHVIAVWANAAVFFVILFTRLLFNLKHEYKKLDGYLKAAALVCIGSMIISMFLPHHILMGAFLFLLSSVVLTTFTVICWLALKGITIARYYCLAWSFLLVSAIIAILDYFGVITTSIPIHYLLMVGATMETLLLTYVVAIGYSQHREQLYASNQKALVQERAVLSAQEDLMTMQQQYQDELEYKVQERTLELEIALRELSEANQELERLNSIDSLTGIRNRRYFDKRLLAEGRRSRREKSALSLAMLDIDHFKQINDRYGHSAGDACICHVATLLQQVLKRSCDDVCRYGGEEFGVILPNTDLEGARTVIETMRQKVENTPVIVDGEGIQMTLSAGVSSVVVTAQDQETILFKHADSLLYRAKQSGRNKVVAEHYTGIAS